MALLVATSIQAEGFFDCVVPRSRKSFAAKLSNVLLSIVRQRTCEQQPVRRLESRRAEAHAVTQSRHCSRRPLSHECEEWRCFGHPEHAAIVSSRLRAGAAAFRLPLVGDAHESNTAEKQKLGTSYTEIDR